MLALLATARKLTCQPISPVVNVARKVQARVIRVVRGWSHPTHCTPLRGDTAPPPLLFVHLRNLVS